MRKYIINCDNMKSEEDFWNEYIACVDIEGKEYFGRNLDALWDALYTDGPGSPKDRTCCISVCKKTDAIRKLGNSEFYNHLCQIACNLDIDSGCTLKFRVN